MGIAAVLYCFPVNNVNTAPERFYDVNETEPANVFPLEITFITPWMMGSDTLIASMLLYSVSHDDS